MENQSFFIIKSNLPYQQQINLVDTKEQSEITLNHDIELLDITDDEEEDDERINTRNQFPCEIGSSSEPLTYTQVIQLKTLLLGDAKKSLPNEWIQQYFNFNKIDSLYYGLTQDKGGPCGVLASVQAYLLIELFFNEQSQDQLLNDQEQSDIQYSRHLLGYQHANESDKQKINSKEELKVDLKGGLKESQDHDSKGDNISRDKLLISCLAKAIARILFKISNGKTVTLAIENTSRVHQTNSVCFDGITERITIKQFDELDQLFSFLNYILQINPYSIGCISLVYSCLLTRGLNKIQSDFDSPSTCLIVQHNYCGQELVNLMLTGHAVANVFNHQIKCDSMILKGINQQSQIGFLSLYEHYKSCEVGSYYKNPLYPVWIVLSESHFSVLFSKRKLNYTLASSSSNNKRFDLFYYDGLSQQDNEIRLTITLKNQQEYDDRLVGKEINSQVIIPINEVIKTKWPNADISWNEVNPIL